MNLLRRLVLPSAFAAALAGCAAPAPVPAPMDEGRTQALEEFVVAYRLAEAWPRAVAKIAHDSLPRLEDATHADLDADAFPDAAHAQAAHARVAALLPAGRRELEAELRRFDAGEFARATAFEVYGPLFDTDEIRQICAFYESPAGRKLSAQAPQILAESRRPRAGDVMARHFDADELARIAAFWNSPVGVKLNATAEQVREAMHARFVERSEPALRAVARRLADRAEAASP